jgi:hypothetical protein
MAPVQAQVAASQGATLPSNIFTPGPGAVGRQISRDCGYSVPVAGNIDVWIFCDTSIYDDTQKVNSGNATNYFIASGTAGYATDTTPLYSGGNFHYPSLSEPVEPNTPNLPYQFLPSTTGCAASFGDTSTGSSSYLARWTSGAVNLPTSTGALSDNILVYYQSFCVDEDKGATFSKFLPGNAGVAEFTVNPANLSIPLSTTASSLVARNDDLFSPQVNPSNPGDSSACNVTTPSATFTNGPIYGGDGYIYVYRSGGSGCADTELARVPTSGSSWSNPAAYTYLTTSGTWASWSSLGSSPMQKLQNTLVPNDGYNAIIGGGISVERFTNGGAAPEYLMTYDPYKTSPFGGFGQFAIRYASSPAGPWSAPMLVTLPGCATTTGDGCYAFYAHPELSTAGNLAVSYYLPNAYPATLSVTNGSTTSTVTPGAVVLANVGLPGAVATASTPDHKGYWTVSANGDVQAFGDAGFYGDSGDASLGTNIVGIAATGDAKGYWLVGANGAIFAYGDAVYHGGANTLTLSKPIVGIAADRATGGYWLVGADGAIYAYDAPYDGGANTLTLSKPIVGIAPDSATGGYWLVGADGAIYAYDAPYEGGANTLTLSKPIVGIAGTPGAAGYWLVGGDGGVFSYGAATSQGSVYSFLPAP